MERKELNETLFTKAFQVVSQSTMKFASCDDDPGNSVNAYLWGGVQGVVALSLLFAPIFLRRTHVIDFLYEFLHFTNRSVKFRSQFFSEK
ncbi:hypothetical protein [Leptospira noguchii]|uniref:hypothetical protein n=1 Tax=Leptospira noguchii TaxID=28182 RepID=UPI000310C986|nr:hypothetical protein [Leptospira noguchii]